MNQMILPFEKKEFHFKDIRFTLVGEIQLNKTYYIRAGLVAEIVHATNEDPTTPIELGFLVIDDIYVIYPANIKLEDEDIYQINLVAIKTEIKGIEDKETKKRILTEYYKIKRLYLCYS